ncbi:MAG: hypothetical protein C0622_03710 [Desulfuromonas sp.]|nr:MAG: hypothetical protein C0622_03710 [Desulfuromonas sp.]
MTPGRLLLITLFLLTWLTGCQGPTLKIEPIAPTESPSAKIFELEERLTAGRAGQLNVLSPTWYAKAESYLDKARYGLAHNDAANAILENVAYGYAHLAKAEEFSQQARATIPEVIKARDLANAAGAASFSFPYLNLENRFIGLTLDIEGGHPQRARKFSDNLAQDYADLELRAIKEKTLGKVRDLLTTARDNGADDLTPTMLAIAQKALDEADQFITEQRYEREKMQEKANFALFQAQRVEQIMTLSQKLKDMSPEALALWSEARLHQITDQLGARDLRNESTDLQLENIIQSVIALQDDNSSLKNLRQQEATQYNQKLAELQTLIEAQQEQIAALEGASAKARQEHEQIAQKEQELKTRLEAEQRFQQLFTEVQELFTTDQAEVYRQADSLVIRLKAMQFPVGKDLIMPDNYPLLSRVRQAIRNFGDPQVIIEGHTDSTGAAAVNALLSQNRAEAVRQYFLANGTFDEDRITAIGFGSDRPLAPNDTPQGRALNRRIDVVIKTEKANN